MNKTILIVGAGTGGVVTAHSLARSLSHEIARGKNRIIVFEKESHSVFAPSLLWLMTGTRTPDEIQRPMSAIVRKGIQVVQGRVTSIDPENKVVEVNGSMYKGDYMVLAMGAELVSDFNLENYGCNFYELKGATDFRDRLKQFQGGRIVVLVSALPFKCPAAPVESAFLTEDFIGRHGVGDKTEISLYTPEPHPMPIAGTELGVAIRQMLEQRNIRYYPEHQIVSASATELSFSNGNKAPYDLLAYIPRHVCPSVIRHLPIVGDNGWVKVDKHTLETVYQDVYAIGDVTAIPLEMGKPLPKAGVFAHSQAEVVAANIAASILGHPGRRSFAGDGKCFLELGNGVAGYSGGDFYATPRPIIKMRKPSFLWHWGKVLFEKYWFIKHF